mgnify:FL=1
MEKKWRIGLVRVITLADRAQAECHARQIMERFPALEVETLCIPGQPEGIHSPGTKAEAVPKILDTAMAFRDKDAIIISCADDPGVEQLRALLPVPVVGAGSSVAALARRWGPRAGVLGITDYAPDPYAEMFGENLINLGRPDHVASTLDLMTEAGRQGVLDLGRRLKAAGAQSIALACTGMSTVGMAPRLQEAVGLPVVDPVLAEGLFAYYECVQKQ